MRVECVFTCPSLVDRVKPVYLTADQKKNKDARVPDKGMQT